ncbi:hypothetical protein Sjap_011776 [Stephania japonica]|uniref:Uncharacterized protein n=1 Tax=Stephania japonica TaxID=461633 RepID=A0AAP0P5V3_9MAGN
MAAVAGEKRRDLVEQKKDKKEEVAELLKRVDLGQLPDDEIRWLIRLQLDRRIRWGYKTTYEPQLANVLNFAQCPNLIVGLMISHGHVFDKGCVIRPVSLDIEPQSLEVLLL